MTWPLDPASGAAWRDAGLTALRLRTLQARDLDAIAEILQRGEGYTRVSAEPWNLDEIRRDLDGFAEAATKDGLVVERQSSEAPVAFLLYFVRDRTLDTFPEGSALAQLDASSFPANGRFLQIYDLWVDPSLRRQGAARALKIVLEKVAITRQIEMIYTTTEAIHHAVLTMNAHLGYAEVYRGPMWDAVERVALTKRWDNPAA